MIDDLQLKLAAHLATGLAYTFLCAFFTWLHSVPNGGHKRDLTVSAVFFLCVSISRFSNAWQVIHGVCLLTRMSDVVAIVAAVGLLIYAPLRFKDAAITLVRSEWVQRIRANKDGDAETENILMPIAAQGTLMQSEQILSHWRRRGYR